MARGARLRLPGRSVKKRRETGAARLRFSRACYTSRRGRNAPLADAELRLLHHHGGAVLLIARRQRAAGRRDRAADAGRRAVVADPLPEVLLRGVLRGARPLCRRIRRPAAQGPRDAHRQLGEDRRLPAAAVGGRPAARLRGGRTGRGSVLIHARVSGALLGFDLPFIDTDIDTPAEAAIAITAAVYAIAALFNLYVPRTGVALKPRSEE